MLHQPCQTATTAPGPSPGTGLGSKGSFSPWRLFSWACSSDRRWLRAWTQASGSWGAPGSPRIHAGPDRGSRGALCFPGLAGLKPPPPAESCRHAQHAPSPARTAQRNKYFSLHLPVHVQWHKWSAWDWFLFFGFVFSPQWGCTEDKD